MRVLLVDDEERIRKTWRRALEDEGHELVGCRSIKNATPLLKQEWDVILLDIYLPDGEGPELLRHMSAEQVRSVAVFSAYLETRHSVELDRQGVLASAKPTKIPQMMSLIDRIVERRSQMGPTSEQRARAWAKRHKLTARQTEVLVLGVRGMGNDQIAETLGCGGRPIETHWKRISDNTGLRGRAAIVAAVA